MARNIQAIADRLGATIVGQVPETGGGAFGAARLAHIVAALRAGSAEQGEHLEVPIKAATIRKLTLLAEQASTTEHKVSLVDIAAQLLEEAVAGLPVE